MYEANVEFLNMHEVGEPNAQVQLLFSERELVFIFLSTLASPSYEHLTGVATTNFTTLIQVGERIEDGMKTERISSHKLKVQIEESFSKKHEEWTTLDVTQKRKSVQTIEFHKKSKKE